MLINKYSFLKKDTFAYSPKTMARYYVKMALLVLCSPITLLLSSTALKDRMVAWLNRDLLSDECFNIWSTFNDRNGNKYIPLTKQEFNKFFTQYPKTLTFLSRSFDNAQLVKNDSNELYHAIRQIMRSDYCANLYLKNSEKYLDMNIKNNVQDSRKYYELSQHMIASAKLLEGNQYKIFFEKSQDLIHKVIEN